MCVGVGFEISSTLVVQVHTYYSFSYTYNVRSIRFGNRSLAWDIDSSTTIESDLKKKIASHSQIGRPYYGGLRLSNGK